MNVVKKNKNKIKVGRGQAFLTQHSTKKYRYPLYVMFRAFIEKQTVAIANSVTHFLRRGGGGQIQFRLSYHLQEYTCICS